MDPSAQEGKEQPPSRPLTKGHYRSVAGGCQEKRERWQPGKGTSIRTVPASGKLPPA